MKPKALIWLAVVLMGAYAGCGGDNGGDEDVVEDPAQDPSAEDMVSESDAVGDPLPDQDAVPDPVEDPAPDAAEDVTPDATEDAVDMPAEEMEPPACIDPEPSPGDGEHHAGDDCLSCHASQPASRRWTVAGTLYSDASGSSAVSGATVEVVDSEGKTVGLVTHDNGNFYTIESFAFPVQVRASKCPDDAPMASAVTNGSCNSCHNSSFRIHLP